MKNIKRTKMKRAIIIFSTLCAIVYLFGCMEDDLELDKDWNTYTRPLNTALPVFKAHMSASSLLKQIDDSTTISVDDEGLLYVHYSQPLKAEWFDVAKINQMELNIVHDLNPAITKSDMAQTVNFEERIKLNLIGEQVYDSIFLNDATLTTIVDWPEGFTGDYTVTFPDILQDGKALVFVANPAADINASERLPNFWIYPQHAPDSSYIRILISANVEAPTSLPTNTRLQVTVKFDKLIPELIFGKFGTIPVFEKDMSMPFTFFESYDLFDGIEFTGMNVTLNINNYTGTPYSVTMSNTELSRRKTEETMNVTFAGNNTFFIDQPDFSTPVIPKNNLLVLDSTNSNLREAFNFFPDMLKYHLVITSNPNGQLQENFLHRRNKVDGTMELNLPFWFRITNLWRNDTIPFDIAALINDSSNTKYVDKMALMFDFENGFPFELFTQGDLVNDDLQVIDTLFGERTAIWLSGKLDENDRVVESVNNQFDMVFTKEQIKKYVDNHVTKIILHTDASTSNSGNRFVKLYDNYAVNIRFYFAIESNLNNN